MDRRKGRILGRGRALAALAVVAVFYGGASYALTNHGDEAQAGLIGKGLSYWLCPKPVTSTTTSQYTTTVASTTTKKHSFLWWLILHHQTTTNSTVTFTDVAAEDADVATQGVVTATSTIAEPTSVSTTKRSFCSQTSTAVSTTGGGGG